MHLMKLIYWMEMVKHAIKKAAVKNQKLVKTENTKKQQEP